MPWPAAGDGLQPPAPLDPATAAVALALIDQETPAFLDQSMRAASSWLTFHCGAPIAQDAADADFALCLACPDLAALRLGSDEAPETSSTLILQVTALDSGIAFRLAGPGLAEPAILRVAGLPVDFAASWQRNHALFPRGIDIVLCAGNRLTALPRSLSLEAV
jgi:alpha-D-ribose 1-methylphosphonate 5-triphosphate synthase subunit PhnH